MQTLVSMGRGMRNGGGHENMYQKHRRLTPSGGCQQACRGLWKETGTSDCCYYLWQHNKYETDAGSLVVFGLPGVDEVLSEERERKR